MYTNIKPLLLKTTYIIYMRTCREQKVPILKKTTGVPLYELLLYMLCCRVNKKLDEDPNTSHDFVTLVGLVSYYGAD